MNFDRLTDTLTGGPARRRRRMTRALEALDRADAQDRRRGGDQFPANRPSPRNWAPSGPALAGADAHRRRGPRRARAVVPSPVFLAFLGAAAGGGALAWSAGAGSRWAGVGVFVLVAAGWVASVSLHEFAHAYTAHRAGDRHVQDAGYLTLNPFRYAHPVLSVLLPLLAIMMGGIGLPGGAVQIHRHEIGTRARRSAVAAAGPATNLLLGGAALGLVAFHGTAAHLAFWAGLAFFGFLQLAVAVLNLLPVPGLDGWGILEPYLPARTTARAERIKPWGLLAVFVLLAMGPAGALFARVVAALADVSGVPRMLWQLGAGLFRFWQG